MKLFRTIALFSIFVSLTILYWNCKDGNVLNENINHHQTITDDPCFHSLHYSCSVCCTAAEMRYEVKEAGQIDVIASGTANSNGDFTWSYPGSTNFDISYSCTIGECLGTRYNIYINCADTNFYNSPNCAN
ncbi:MAG: hypothetical protein L0Y79_11885 [Chlorobi bacterium]|nr:hypothetical protein [Chlorobiota bacterium]MCI0715274.1 hypothetical protein [Chlorobiota bacterium]